MSTLSPARSALPSSQALLDAIASAIIVVDGRGRILFVNPAAEQFFGFGSSYLLDRRLEEILPEDNPVFSLVRQARDSGAHMFEYGIALESPRMEKHDVTVQATPLPDHQGLVALTFNEGSTALKIDRQLSHRNAARSVTGMAAILAHEVKNPLSGIRGAAQLLEYGVANDDDRKLTQLIRDEADRIVALVDRMEMFSDRPPALAPVNIHQVLEHVRRVAQNGFAGHVRVVEHYDPSLPEVYGNRDRLIQALLNLIKNAAEAVSTTGGEIVLSTAFQRGMRLAVPGRRTRVHLPLRVSVQDNGPGIPEELRSGLFDAFVSSKPRGQGLGLALVAKIVSEHGGIVEFDSRAGRTVFHLLLPMYEGKRT
ncbi:MAG: ATP-binding protein [Acetobacterales bacterium]